jgi:GNAT superfamily N-acetyltransferase
VRRIAEVRIWSWQGAYQGLLPQADCHEVCGFADFGPTRDDDGDKSQVGEVRAIYLVPEVWGKGFGRQLSAATRWSDDRRREVPRGAPLR